MSVIQVRKGRNLKIKGSAVSDVVDAGVPAKVAIQPLDFRTVKPRLLVKENDAVEVGTPLIEDKTRPGVVFVSPASGRVSHIHRGEKRALLQIVIETDGNQTAHRQRQIPKNEVEKISREALIELLLSGGFWPFIRQRPFSHIADPKDTPKSIFVQAMNTEPLALNVDIVLEGREKEFQTGLNILRKLTSGGIHLCIDNNAKSKALNDAKNVSLHRFSGPHPAGNISTAIHFIDPINKGDLVWYIKADDVLKVAFLLSEGYLSPEKVVAVTGEGAQNRDYKKTVIGASIKHLLNNDSPDMSMRYISGSVLTGKNVGASGFVCFYDSQITVFPEGGKREFMGWISPGWDKFSFTKTFVSSFMPEREVSLDADRHGDFRAIVLNHIYDDYVSLDIPTYFLLKAVLSGDIEEAERLGILECDEEDFALCSFACPSKTDVGGIIREGLDLIEREG